MSYLAEKLKIGTQQVHHDAEHTNFMKTFLSGGINRDSFCLLLSNLYFVYSQLEAELERHKTDPIINRIYFPELNRTANLEQDLTFYYSQNWQEHLAPSPAAQVYITRIFEISAYEPILLISHAYTRYMGDLSGGQSLKRIAQTLFKLKENQGIRFYEFDQITNLNEFKNTYRQALNQLSLDEALEDKIVEEANHAFQLNITMLRDLSEPLIPSFV